VEASYKRYLFDDILNKITLLLFYNHLYRRGIKNATTERLAYRESTFGMRNTWYAMCKRTLAEFRDNFVFDGDIWVNVRSTN